MSEPVAASSLRVVARSITPLFILLVGYPVWWTLGVHMLGWGLVGALVAAWAWRNRDHLLLPEGFGWFAVFIGWVLISAFTLTGSKYALSYSFRLVIYTTVILIGLQLFNLIHLRVLHPDQIQRWLLWIWGCAIVLAIPGLVTNSTIAMQSPFGAALSKLGINNPFIEALTTVQLSSVDSLYGLARPSPLFEFTNAWGAAMGVLTPLAIHALVTTTSKRERWVIGSVLVLSIWPIVVSVNRGCWVSIILALGYVAMRRTFARDLRAAAVFVVGLVSLGVVVLVTPLASVVAERLQTANTDTRSNLYSAAIDLASRSPLLGYGAPQSSALVEDSNDVSIGTHGQFWTILVSHGYVGVGLFMAGVVAVWWLYRPTSGQSPDIWLHASGPVVLFQMFVYDVVPIPMVVFFCCHAVIAEHRRIPSQRDLGPDVSQEGSSLARLA